MKYITSFPLSGILILTFLFSCHTQESKISFLALGDSYTIGQSVAPQKRWPVQLTKVLKKQGLQVAEPRILAATGWTTLDLQQAISEARLQPSYDLVSLLIGVNDQYRNFDIGNYPKNFRYLLTKAIELANGKPDHVLVLSIPDYSVTPFASKRDSDKIAEEINSYNAINNQISHDMGVHYVNITPISRQAVSQPGLIADDKLHPSETMYRKWVEQVMPVILPEIKTWKDQ